ncbi:hypothetical protein FB451DRAFT_1174189 [Mycena latifolia]|nr:hypothetical protein FB451DRAFT_1174189 [Mycena latifolia]
MVQKRLPTRANGLTPFPRQWFQVEVKSGSPGMCGRRGWDAARVDLTASLPEPPASCVVHLVKAWDPTFHEKRSLWEAVIGSETSLEKTAGSFDPGVQEDSSHRKYARGGNGPETALRRSYEVIVSGRNASVYVCGFGFLSRKRRDFVRRRSGLVGGADDALVGVIGSRVHKSRISSRKNPLWGKKRQVLSEEYTRTSAFGSRTWTSQVASTVSEAGNRGDQMGRRRDRTRSVGMVLCGDWMDNGDSTVTTDLEGWDLASMANA